LAAAPNLTGFVLFGKGVLNVVGVRANMGMGRHSRLDDERYHAVYYI